jgi:hypothetical protein
MRRRPAKRSMGIRPLQSAIAVLRALAGSFVPSQREFSTIPAALGFDRYFGAGLRRIRRRAKPSQPGAKPPRPRGDILDHDDRGFREGKARGDDPVRNPSM